MSISRHNYEEYFILYMDNELAAEDRRAVEAFAQLHPDLKDELDLLLQYKLTPDTSIVFTGKEELVKINGETPLSLSNYEEWMVLYTDNELSAEQKSGFEQFMIAHPSLQQEFEQLKMARLEPETIVFGGKASLYRKEERVRRLPVWWRFAAAAILLLAIGITAVIIINKNDEVKNDGIADKPAPVIKNNTKAPVINTPAPNKENIAVTNKQEENRSPVATQTKENNIAVKKVIPLKKENRNDIIIPELEKEEPVVVIRKSNDLPTPLNKPNSIAINKVDKDITNGIPPEVVQHKDGLTKPGVTTGDPDPSDPVYASFDDEKKNKGRGLFRKIARTFEKRTSIDPTDDNRLLVAGLAIKLK
jgi:hypothetical protein